MKVTATIREYIKAEIAKIFDAKVNPYTEQAERDKEMIEAFGAHLRAVQQEMIDQFITDNNLFEYNRYIGKTNRCVLHASSPGFSYVVTPAMIDARKWDEEQVANKASKTREIIAKLELGASRTELEAMLAELASNI